MKFNLFFRAKLSFAAAEHYLKLEHYEKLEKVLDAIYKHCLTPVFNP
jgi:hypothetical protein